MSEITLVVTRAEVEHYRAGHPDEAQIAMRDATPDIEPRIKALTANNRARITLGGCVTPVAGDPGAIWRAHNGQYAEVFDSLFNTLARRPGVGMRCLCSIQ